MQNAFRSGGRSGGRGKHSGQEQSRSPVWAGAGPHWQRLGDGKTGASGQFSTSGLERRWVGGGVGEDDGERGWCAVRRKGAVRSPWLVWRSQSLHGKAQRSCNTLTPYHLTHLPPITRLGLTLLLSNLQSLSLSLSLTHYGDWRVRAKYLVVCCPQWAAYYRCPLLFFLSYRSVGQRTHTHTHTRARTHALAYKAGAI